MDAPTVSFSHIVGRTLVILPSYVRTCRHIPTEERGQPRHRAWFAVLTSLLALDCKSHQRRHWSRPWLAPASIQKKTVLITGCSTGSIGWALTKVFLEHDFHVFAGVRSRSKAQDLAELSSVDLVELDVTVPQTISQCKQMVAERTGGKLDVLVSS